MKGFFIALEYLGADSNCHAHSGATPSRWCVYQFRHPGIYAANISFETKKQLIIQLFLQSASPSFLDTSLNS